LDQRDERRLRRDRQLTQAYGLVLLSILISIVCAVSLGRSGWGRWFVAVSQGATLILTLRIAGAMPRTRIVTVVFVILAVVVAGVAQWVGESTTSHLLGAAIGGLLVIGAPIAIARGAGGHVEVTAQTVMAALSIYLLVGLFFAFVYGVMATVGSGPFFSGTDGSLPDRVYFSFSTLTTVGFGDLAARGDIGRLASVVEALTGQLYLVTVVAVLVGNLRSRRN
jgi:hypothetical protein